MLLEPVLKIDIVLEPSAVGLSAVGVDGVGIERRPYREELV